MRNCFQPSAFYTHTPPAPTHPALPQAYAIRQAEKEEARLAELERIAEERKKAAEEEFEEWKGSFDVVEAGEDADDEDTASNKLQQFIDHIRTKKVVVLDELAAEFGMKTQAVVERVTQLEEDGRITGVIDDRGKFIYITQDEMQAVRKFIERKGRVSQAVLAAESNKLVDLNEAAPAASAAAGAGAGAAAGSGS